MAATGTPFGAAVASPSAFDEARGPAGPKYAYNPFGGHCDFALTNH